MEKIYADPHMENDNTEHIRRKQLSSILKAPRNPLDDLGNGNELTQGVSTEKRRRTLRRVSFANTINCRVFERDLKNNTEGGTEGAADAENDVLPHQSEEPGAASCEITGMNTLLHAPIQALVQQTEVQDGDSSIPRANRQDTTLLLSEDDETDMTAGHTGVIAQDLGSSRAEQPEMDITSLLPGGDQQEAKAEARRPVCLFSDLPSLPCPGDGQQEDATAVKKINFTEFFMSFQSKRTLSSAKGPQYAFFPPLQASEDVAQSSREFVCSHEDSCDVTRVFTGQDDGMEVTRCQASAIRAEFPALCEAPAQQFPCAEVTKVFADDEMEMTSSHTAEVPFPFTVGNQNLSFPKDPPPPEAGNSMFKRASSQHVTVQHEQLCADRRPASAEDRQDPAALQAARQEARGMAAIPGSISSETVFRGGPPPRCEDMEITGDYSGVVSADSSSCPPQAPGQPASAWLAESRCPARGDRAAPRGQTAADSPAPGPSKPPELSSGSDGRLERATQGHSTAPVNAWLDPRRSPAPAGVSQSRLQPRLSLLSLPTEKTLVLSEDMDLTKPCVVRGDGRDAENESAAGVFTPVACKPQFTADRATSPSVNEQEEMEMTKCHVVVIDDQCTRVTTEGKGRHCEIIPRRKQNRTVSEGGGPLDVDKENVGVLSVDGKVRRSQAMEIRAKGLEVVKADKLGRISFQASGPSSSAQSVCPLQEQKREVPENAVTSTSVSLQSQKVMSQPLGGSLLEASVSKGTTSGSKPLPCAGEKASTFSADADMGITRSHPVPADYRRVLQHGSAGDDSPSPSGDQTCVFTYGDDMEMTALSAVGKPVEEAVPQGMLHLAKRTRRKSLKKPAGEETVWFSLDDENNDMDTTQSHTAAIGQEILSQNKGGLCSVSSAGAVTTTLFPGSQANMAITKPCSGAPSTSNVVCADNPSLEGCQEAGQQAWPSSEATMLAVENMEITTTLNPSEEENALPGAQPLASSTITFHSSQADREMTQSPPLGESIRRAFCEDRSQLAKQEAVPGSRTILFSSAEDMEVTRTLTGVLRGSVGVQARESIPATPAVPADRALVFAHSQDDMEITTSHTTAVNNIPASESQQVPHQGTQQPDLHHEALSSCRDKRESSHKDPDGEYHPGSKEEPNTPPASSASAFPAETGAVQVPSGTAPDSVCSASLPEETMVVQAPQDPPPPVVNPAPVSSQQDLLPPESLKSKGLSFRLPGCKPVDHSEESGDVVSHIAPPAQHPEPLMASPDACSTQGNQVLKGCSSQDEDLATDLGLAGVPASNKELQEGEELPAGGEAPPGDVCISLEQTEQLLVSDSSRDPTEPGPAAELSGISNVCSKLEDIRRKSTVLSVYETAFAEQLPKPSVQPEDTLRLEKGLVKEPNHLSCTKEQGQGGREPRAAPGDASTGTALQGQYQGVKGSLGIFQPKLPNRRASASSVQGTNAKCSADTGEAAASERCVRSGESPGPSKPGRQNFSPSRFVAEEFLPVYLEEMDPNESVSCELMESACSERGKSQVPHHEKNPFEKTKTCSKPKRALEEDEEDLQSPKKVKSDEGFRAEASPDLQVTCGAVSQSQAEVHEGEDPPSLSAQSLDCTHASTSSSLDSVKADAELTMQRSSQVESQLLICEDNLREKFQSGLLTVGEFLTLLQVHIAIQRPRHSHVPSSGAVSAPPTPEDLLHRQYVLRPRLHVYEEDCQALAQKIEELKLHVNVQDQLLVNFNRTLWEVMRTCSDEELKKFGAELNQMKSYFTKESKILAHKEKAELYSKLLQSVQEQQRKIQSRAGELEELLKEAKSCLAPGAGSAWEEWEAECSDEVPGVSCLERELESIESQEEELQRELSDLEAENEQMLVRMTQLKEEEKHYQELLENSESREWDLIEWNEQQGVFSFLYDSVELTVVFEPPRDGDEFREDPSRKIISLGFESLLDEAAAPPSSRLVHRLIFQFIASQGCWQEKCPTLSHLPQVLRDISSVVSNCRILGDEVEFLERWGGKFKLLKTDISDTNLKLVFSSAAAFAKFQLTLSLTAAYPNAPLPFTAQKLLGSVGEEEISAVLSTVPAGLNYLRRIVSSLHQDLLRGPR